MTTFTFSSQYHGRQVEVTWTDGMLTGDPSAVGRIQWLAKGFEGHLVGSSAGPSTAHQHLSNPYVAVEFIQMVLGPKAELTAGSLPTLSDPPEGAVY